MKGKLDWTGVVWSDEGLELFVVRQIVRERVDKERDTQRAVEREQHKRTRIKTTAVVLTVLLLLLLLLPCCCLVVALLLP